LKKLLIIVFVVLLLAPAAALAAGGTFTDDDDSVFEADIEWLAGAGVTLGCNPPTNDNFCPDDNVKRGQMAAFMRRFAAYLGAEDGVVSNADSATLAGTASMAEDADLLDGISSEAFVQHGEIVLRHSTSELTPNWLGGPSTITYFGAGNAVTGDGAVNINLTGPAMIGAVEYGLQSVEYCIEAVGGGATVSLVQVFSAPGVGNPATDSTLRTADGCYTLEVNASGDHAYDLFMTFSGGGSMRVAGVQSTWVPTAMLPASQPERVSGLDGAGGS
jgi:hypothetical protein